MLKRATKFLDTTKASDILNQLASKPAEEKTSIRELLENFHENGFVFAMIFFALPVAVPLPYPPGFTTVMGTPLIILAFQMLIGYDKIHLPERVNNYQINNSTLAMIAAKTVPILRTMEQYIKPRFSFTGSVHCEQLVGFMALLCAISVAIPLPLTNAIPALGIVVMSLGLLNRDGLIVLLGFIVSVIGLLIAASAIIASWIGIKYLFNLVF